MCHLFKIPFVNAIFSLVWLMLFGSILLAIAHIVAVVHCIRKRYRARKVTQEMRVRQKIFSESIIGTGVGDWESTRPKTLHV